MRYLKAQGLTLLDARDLAHIHGGGAELGISLQATPLRGLVDLTYKGSKGTVGGALTLNGKDWAGGLHGAVKIGKATLEGSFSANPKAWEVQATLRIPLG